jgi:hypothetical protein
MATATAPDLPTAAPGLLTTADFDVAIHDCRVTVTSPTGEHRTFRVCQVRWPGDRHLGRRLACLMRGCDNTDAGDWLAFGVVEGGRVRVWPGFLAARFVPADGKRSRFAAYADLLARPAHYEARGCVYQIAGFCRRCGKVLTEPESIRTGLGPTCRKKG